MQKIFTLLFLVACTSIVSAQAVLWGGAADPKSTFTGGLAASGWSSQALSCDNPDSLANVKWTFASDGTGKTGSFWGTLARIASPSGATGAMIFNSDYLDNKGGGVPALGTGPAPSPHSGALVSPLIDCSTFTSGALSFYQFYRNFQSTCFIEVSTDGGANWNEKIQINQEILSGNTTTNTAAGARKIVNISSIIAGKPQVKVRFTFEGDYYFWLIDDVTIISLPDNDLAVTSRFYTPAAYAQPKSQICGDLFSFQGSVANVGGKAATNVVFKGEILGLDRKTVLFADSLILDQLAVNDVDTVTTPNTFDPKSLDFGRYYIRWSSYSKDNAADFNRADNIRMDSFEVTLDVFAKENRAASGTRAGGGAAYSFGNQYRTSDCWGPNDKFRAKHIEYSVTANGSGTLIGYTNTLYLLRVLPEVAADFGNFDRTNGYNSTSIALEGVADFSFTNQANNALVQAPLSDIDNEFPKLQAGTRYFVMVEHPAEPNSNTATWRFQGVNNSRPNEAAMGTPVIGTGNAWFDQFTGGTVPVARLYITVETKTDDQPLAENAISIAPNPVVSTDLQVKINLPNSAYANLTIFGIDGKLESFEHYTDFQNKVIPVNVNALPNGEYFIRVSNDEGTRTKKFVVMR